MFKSSASRMRPRRPAEPSPAGTQSNTRMPSQTRWTVFMHQMGYTNTVTRSATPRAAVCTKRGEPDRGPGEGTCLKHSISCFWFMGAGL